MLNQSLTMEIPSSHDLRPEQYATLIRELIRHEDDVTNHRIMWLLIIQGLLVNVYVPVREQTRPALVVALAGILITLSAFVALYKSYQARGYLRFLGKEAKRGNLEEEYLPMDGWPAKRLKNWRRDEWLCPWVRGVDDLLEPYFFLPFLIQATWTFLRWQALIPSHPLFALGGAFLVTAIVLFVFCVIWVWSQSKNERERAE